MNDVSFGAIVLVILSIIVGIFVLSVLFRSIRIVPQATAGYERVVYMFSGHDPEAVAEARLAWRALKDSGNLTYWQQEADGRWTKKA